MDLVGRSIMAQRETLLSAGDMPGDRSVGEYGLV